MISAKELNRISRFLSLILRHKPEVLNITLDTNGYASIDDIITKCNLNGFDINLKILHYIVDNNDKKRFKIDYERNLIRANQGHSNSLHIDLSLNEVKPPDVLYHGTCDRNISSILELGLIKQTRHHVHLSSEKETAIRVGNRHGNPVLLEISSSEMFSNGFKFYLSENDVYLTNNVPSIFIKVL